MFENVSAKKLIREFLWRVEGFTDAKGMFYYGKKYIIHYWITNGSAQVEVYNKLKDYYLINVAECLEHSYKTPEDEDEWNCNGFSSEYDFVRYKFG